MMNKTTLKKKWSNYWEAYELPIDWGKAEQLEVIFQRLSKLVKEKSGYNVRIPPHVIIRLSQGPLTTEEIGELSLAVVNGILFKEEISSSIKEVPAAAGRKEFRIRGNFIVFKFWTQDGRLDFISMGKSGFRQRTQVKIEKVLGMTKRAFLKLSLSERQTLLRQKLAL